MSQHCDFAEYTTVGVIVLKMQIVSLCGIFILKLGIVYARLFARWQQAMQHGHSLVLCIVIYILTRHIAVYINILNYTQQM